MMKRRFSVLLCTVLVSLCTILLSPKANAAEIIDSGYCGGEGDGTNLTWTLDDEGTLTISGEGTMADYWWDAPWSSWCDSIKQLVITEKVTTVGEYAFAGCALLDRADLPDSLIALCDAAFADCAELQTITLPHNLMFVGNAVFSDCKSLATMEFPDSLSSIGGSAFYNCISLETVFIPANVISIGDNAFSECSSLMSIVVSTDNVWFCDVEGVLFSKDKTKLLYVPIGKKLSLYTVPDGVTTIGNAAFEKYITLKTVIMPDTVIIIEDFAFMNCTNLTYVKISNNLTTIGDSAFDYCVSLSSVILPETLEFIGQGAFMACKKLSSVHIPAKVTYIDTWAFTGCVSLPAFSVDKENPLYSENDGVLFDKGQIELLCYPAGKTIPTYLIPDGVVTVGRDAFSYCNHLKTILIPDSVSVIEHSAFSDCTALTSVIIPDGVSILNDYVFDGCLALTSICLPNSLTEVSFRAMTDCRALTSVNLPKNVEIVSDLAFWGCDELTFVAFNGDAPAISNRAFREVITTAYYPADNPTWTADKLQDYGGTLTWVPYSEDMIYHARFSLDAVPQEAFGLEITVARLGDSANDVAMIALYSPEGKYLETVLWQLTDDTEQIYTLSRDNSGGEIGQVKVFLVDSLSNPVPLAEAAEITSGT